MTKLIPKTKTNWARATAIVVLTAILATLTVDRLTPAAVPTATTPCGTTTTSPHRYAHVLTIVMENHSFSQINGHSPYLNGLAAKCGLATAFKAIRHPSLPNYMAMTGGSTQGITDDCTSCDKNAASIFGQLGGSWKAYQEGIPSTGYLGASSGAYRKKHNPAAYYLPIRSQYATRAVSTSKLATDLAAGTLPRYGFITPNMCNDEHDCSITTGDNWLKLWVPRILNSPRYADGSTLLVITYDEDNGSEGNRIYTVVVAPAVPAHLVVSSPFTLYSLLRTNEEVMGVPKLAAAGTAPSMLAPFHL